MTGLAIDFYGARPNPQAVKTAGYTAVLFYLRNPADPHAYINAGLGVGTIFEYLADESLQGAAKGTADGRLAAQQMTALGQPAGTVHMVNLADFAPTPTQLPAIRAYWLAYLAETSAWRVLPYGTGWLLQALDTLGWQNAMNDNGMVGSAVVPQAVLYQRVIPTLHIAGTAAGEYDEDVILQPLPWWGSPQPSAPVVSATTRPAILLGDNVQKIDIPGGVRLDAAGWTCVDVPLPAGMSHENVVCARMDCASAFDPQSWQWCQAEPDFNQPTAGHVRMVFKGSPGQFFTGRIVVA